MTSYHTVHRPIEIDEKQTQVSEVQSPTSTPEDAITFNENPAIKICNLDFSLEHSRGTAFAEKGMKTLESKIKWNILERSSDSDKAPSQNARHIDFAGPSHIVKDLFALPYSNDIGVAVAVHNVGNGMILLDGAVTHDLKDYETFQFTGTSPRSAAWKNAKRRKRSRPLDHPNGNDLNQNDLASTLSQPKFPPYRWAENFAVSTDESWLMDIHPSIVQRQLMLLQKNYDSQDHFNPHVPSHMKEEENDDDDEQELEEQTESDDPNRLFIHELSQIEPPQADEYTSHITNTKLPNHGSTSTTYLDWRFNEYNMMIQSDAIILSSSENAISPSNPDIDRSKEPKPSHSALPYPSSSNAITLRVAHAERLRLALEQHEAQKKVAKNDPQKHHPYRHHPPMSYAEALAINAPRRLNGKNSDSDSHSNPSLTQSYSKEDSFPSFPDFSKISLNSCALPSTELETKLRGYGYSFGGEAALSTPDKEGGPSSSPVCMILDAYLDNIMANVPQLALCLQDGDLIQGIKVLPTTKLPYLCSSDISYSSSKAPMGGKDASDFSSKSMEPLFVPSMVENNAHMILDFIKTNCIKENQTYLLRRNAGETSVQLLDITMLSKQRQQKWVHWLAMMSLRFAAQLKNLSFAQSDPVFRREYRQKRRNLLDNALQLLFELADIAGSRNEVICSSIFEQLADTYLTDDDDMSTNQCSSSSCSVFKCSFLQPTDLQKLHQPYSKVNINSLSRAQDLLSSAVKELHFKTTAMGKSAVENEALSIQMYGLYHKQINVGIANTRYYLQRYQSSNVMQSLRQVGKVISYASDLLLHCSGSTNKNLKDVVLDRDKQAFIKNLSIHVANLWEECGNFARSFASDELWRDQGHCAGEDICSLLQDVEWSLSTVLHVIETPESRVMTDDDIEDSLSVTTKSKGIISMQYLTGVIPISDDLVLSDVNSFSMDRANSYLQKQKLITREKRRVLVGASVCYGRAADIFMRSSGFQKKSLLVNISGDSLLSLMLKRLGDGCNEVGKALQEEALKIIEVKGYAAIAKDLLSSSVWWYTHALDAFTLCKDKIGIANTAVMHCNLASCAKIRASRESFVLNNARRSINPSKDPLDAAINHLECAHSILEERESIDAGAWDMVSKELASTYLLVGARRRDVLFEKPESQMQSYLTPKIEKSITDPLQKAMQIYSSLNDQCKMATTNLHLAQYYSKIWMHQRSETQTKEKLTNAFAHYQQAHQYFFSHSRGNEYALARLIHDLSNLYKTVSPEKSLLCCIDCQNSFSQESVDRMRRSDSSTYCNWLVQMKDVATKIEDSILSLLQILAKTEKRNEDVCCDFFQILYRSILTMKLATHKEIFDDSMGRFRLSLMLEELKRNYAAKK